MIEVFLDIESRSPLDLEEVGLDRYSAHPETEIQMLGWAEGDGKILQHFPASGRSAADLPPKLRSLIERAIAGEEIIFVAHNSQFERIMLKRIWDIDIPYHLWRDTMILAYSWSLPGKLEVIGTILRLSDADRKLDTGKELVRFFSMPVRKKKVATLFGEVGLYNDPLDFPEKWKQYCEYNVRDVHTERVIWRKMNKVSPLADFVWHEWYTLDQPMNERGMPTRRRMAENALALAIEKKRRLKEKLVKLTGLENPLSDGQMKVWLADKGYPWGTILASYVRQEMANPQSKLTPAAREALKLRAEANKRSYTKYETIIAMLGDDDRLRFQFQFGGAARTFRWAGRGVQPQNLPKADKALSKNYDKVVEFLSTLDLTGDEREKKLSDALDYVETNFGPVVDVVVGVIRGVFQAEEDEEIIVADLNAIENRALGYLAREKEITNVFTTTVEYKGKIQAMCPYCAFGADKMKMGTYMELHAEWKDGDGRRRQIAKAGVLGSGYGQGAGARYNAKTGQYEYIMKVNEHGDTVYTGLVQYAKGMGITLTAKEAVEATDAFRAYKGVPQLWKDLEEGFKRAFRTGEEVHIGRETYRKIDEDGQDVTNIKGAHGRWQWVEVPKDEIVEGAVMVIDRKKLKNFGTIIRIKLPSSRFLHYLNVTIEQEEVAGLDGKPWKRDVIYYEGIEHSATFGADGAKQKKRAKWGKTKTYGGKLAENVDQAFSRDLLVYGFGLASDIGFKIFGCYHDELTALVKKEMFGLGLSDLTWSMSQAPPWSPDMVMGAEGFTTKYYRKG